jgi:hypothetical protein
MGLAEARGCNKMKIFKGLFLFLMFGILLSGNSFAQEKNAKGQPEKDTAYYKVTLKYPLKTYTSYKMTEETEVRRIYSDSSIKEYKRDIVYYITTSFPELPEDGFIKVQVTVDSMTYKFKSGDKEVLFDSQEEEKPIPNFQDLAISSIQLGRTFDLTYSAYNELAKIEGEELDWLKNYIIVEGKDILDTLKKHFWLRGISFERLRYIGDLQKGLIPPGKVRTDSTWKSVFPFEIDGITFTDTASTRIINYNAGIFTLFSNMNNLVPVSEGIVLYDIPYIAQVDTGRGAGTYTLEVRPNGTISKIKAEFEAEAKIKVKNEAFIQKMRSNTSWEQFRQFKWE